MIFFLLMEDYSRVLSSSAEDERSLRSLARCRALTPLELPGRSHFDPWLYSECCTGALLLHTPVQAILDSIWGPRKYTAAGRAEYCLLVRAKGMVAWPRLGTSCHHPGRRHAVLHLQSWRRASLPGTSLRDRIMQRALRKNKDVAMTGPAVWMSPAEMRANPPFVFKDTSPLPVPCMPWLGSTSRAGVPVGSSWGGQRMFKAMFSQAISSALDSVSLLFFY